MASIVVQERKISINGLEINYKIIGEGKPLLVLHGWGSGSEKWQEVGKIIAEKGFKIIIPNLPGFGKSQNLPNPWCINDYCGFLQSLVESLEMDKFCLLGHSFGGAISSKYAVLHPQKIEKLFLVGASCLRKKTFRKIFLTKFAKFFNFLSFLPFYALLRKGFYKYIVQKSDYLNTQGVLRETFLNIINEDLSDKLLLVTVPTVIIWGDKDDIIPLKNGLEINKRIKGSKMVIIKGGDHHLEQRMPEILSQKILENLSD